MSDQAVIAEPQCARCESPDRVMETEPSIIWHRLCKACRIEVGTQLLREDAGR